MKAIYLDCFAGISGNMMLGALLDAGVPEQYLREELGKLQLNNEYCLVIKPVVKCGISAVYVDVQLNDHHHQDDHNHGNHHHHHHHHHRHLPDILAIIDGSNLEQGIKDNSKKVFMRLAEAEAKVHGTTVDKIHFHEVGAVDAIVDIVGTIIGLHYLGIEAIYTSKLQVGTGFIQCSHGSMPIPAPATAELLSGIPYYNGELAKELVTPTGAAIIAALGNGYGAMPEQFRSQRIAYGAGTWDLKIPNVLRLQVGEISTLACNTEDCANHSTFVIEANIDDLNPQVYEYVMEKMLNQGALDVWLTPIIMKKSRPATLLSVLVKSQDLHQIQATLLTETSTIGMRYYPVQRIVAERKLFTIQSPWGQARVKISYYDGEICSISPEYEDCKRLADEHNIPLKVVQHAIREKALTQLNRTSN